MAEKKAPQVQTKGIIVAVEAYRILLKRQISEDRILAERTSIFLLASSFLFLAFVTLLNPGWTGYLFTALRILLPSVGIFLTILLFLFNQSASIASTFWHEAQRKIEGKADEAGVFSYMEENDIAPHIAEAAYMKGKKDWIRDDDDKSVIVDLSKPRNWWQRQLLHNRVIYRYYLPTTFFVLWATSLVLVIVC
jgi:hypothetical protein